MAGVRVFTDLHIWQAAREWQRGIFPHTRRGPFRSDARLVSQINDSSESVMANIAEGFGRGTQAEFVQFLDYAIGSLNETQSHLTAAYDRGYVAEAEYSALFHEGTRLRQAMLKFKGSMNQRGSGAKYLRKQISWTERIHRDYQELTGKPHPAIAKTREMERKEPLEG